MAVGTRVRVNMGPGTGKLAVVVPRRVIPTDGQGVPRIGRGHYKPMDRNDVAIRYEDGTLDVYNAVHLTRV